MVFPVLKNVDTSKKLLLLSNCFLAMYSRIETTTYVTWYRTPQNVLNLYRRKESQATESETSGIKQMSRSSQTEPTVPTIESSWSNVFESMCTWRILEKNCRQGSGSGNKVVGSRLQYDHQHSCIFHRYANASDYLWPAMLHAFPASSGGDSWSDLHYGQVLPRSRKFNQNMKDPENHNKYDPL